MTQYLIDTHVAYWLISDDREHLPESIREDIETFQNQYFISVASLIELVDLQRKKAIHMDASPLEVHALLAQWNIITIDITPDILETYYREGIPETAEMVHKDPFDRLIIATAITRRLTLISADHKFPWWQRHRHLDLLYFGK